MSLSLTPITLSVTSLGSPDFEDELTFGEDVPGGSFLVLAYVYRMYSGSGATGAIIDDAAGFGNSYSYGDTTPTSGGQPWVVLAAGRTRYDIENGVTKLQSAGYGLGPLVRIWKLEGADSFAQIGLTRSYEDDPTPGSDSLTWTGNPGSFPTLEGEHILIGLVAAGIAGGVGITQTGDFTDTDLASVSIPAYSIFPAENWDSLAGTALVNPGSATGYEFKGDFLPAADCWLAAQAAYAPIWFGMGRERSLARGPDSRLVESEATAPIAILRDREVSGASSSISGFGRSTSLLYDRSGRLIHLGCFQADAVTNPVDSGYGGYTVQLHTSRNQGRTWDAGQTLFSPGSPVSSDPGYLAAEAALDGKSGLLLLMLYDSVARRWLSSVGKLNSAGTSWSFTAPVERITNAAPSGHLLHLASGRFRFLYIADGSFVRWLEENAGFNTHYLRVTDGDQVRFVDIDGLASDGAADFSSPITAHTAPAPSGTLPADVTYTMLDGVNWLEDKGRGLHLVAFHERVFVTADYLVTGAGGSWRAVAGSLGTDGVTWSFAAPVTLHVASSLRDGAFNRRGDGAWRWVEGANMRLARALDATTGAGAWS